jgi:hypothetical protein
MQETKLRFFICQGPTRDEVIANLRNAFMKIADEYKVYTEEEKNKVILNTKETLKAHLSLLNIALMGSLLFSGHYSRWASRSRNRAS